MLCATFGKLIIYSPSSLKESTGDGDGVIDISVANFGLIPYGHSIVGAPYFDPDNADGCDKFSNQLSAEGGESPIVIINIWVIWNCDREKRGMLIRKEG